MLKKTNGTNNTLSDWAIISLIKISIISAIEWRDQFCRNGINQQKELFVYPVLADKKLSAIR